MLPGLRLGKTDTPDEMTTPAPREFLDSQRQNMPSNEERKSTVAVAKHGGSEASGLEKFWRQAADRDGKASRLVGQHRGETVVGCNICEKELPTLLEQQRQGRPRVFPGRFEVHLTQATVHNFSI